MANLRTFENVEQLNSEFAEEICQLLSKGLAETGRASLLVSGGRTPKALFNDLSGRSVNWKCVDVALVDERWVEETSSDSNTAMVKRELLINKAREASFYPLKTEHNEPQDGLIEAEQNIKSMSRPFDVLILGMGEDGHTASIFPCAEPALRDAGLDMNSAQMLVAMQPATAPHQRISLTMPAILSAKKIFLHLVGSAKKAVLINALGGQDVKEMPIRAVLHQTKTPVDIMFCE